VLAEIQQACADYLNGVVTPPGLPECTFFKKEPAIKVITEQLDDYESAIERDVQSLGICVLIMTVTAKDSQNQFPGGLAFDKIDVRARAMGDPFIAQRTVGVDVATAAEAAAWYLRKLRPLDRGGTLTLQSIELAEDRAAPVAYDAIFSLSAESDSPPER